ncbi:MAG: neutral/alkaline non-lysosomal ceramidase N-terminal domain-containing protein [Isosphaeraceae bacterium]
MVVHRIGLLTKALLLYPAIGRSQPPAFRAGAATSNVTPRLGSSMNGGMTNVIASHVHDELHARCLVLDDGGTKLALVVVDSCMLPRDLVLDAKRRIAEQSGIPADHVMISATHSHSTPASAPVFQSGANPEYLPFLAERIADAVRRAVNNLAPSQIGWGAGQVPDEVFNRRWRLKPSVQLVDPFGRPDQVRMNPTPGSPDLVEPAGPVDPELSILAAVQPNGLPVAALANYSLHYVGGVGAGHVSADYFGFFASRLATLLSAEHEDPPFVAMMTNGTSGDVNNIDFRTARPAAKPYERIAEVGNTVACEAQRVIEGITYRKAVSLDARAAEISLQVRKPSRDEIGVAEAILKKAEGRPLRGMDEIYARETKLLASYPDRVDLTIQAMRIGDLAIVAIPCEVFTEIGLKLKAESPIRPMFTVELANGYNGYLPTTGQHALGGYETWRARSSYLEKGAADAIVTKALALLADLKRSTTRD